MKLQVTERGVLIPKELLGNSQEVEITQLENQIIIKNVNNNLFKVNDGNDQSCYDLAKKLGIIGIAKDLD